MKVEPFKLPIDFFDREIIESTKMEVENELAKPADYNIKRLQTLLSGKADLHLEEMARQARQVTLQRFGRNKQMYAPLYVSNFCQNDCLYCGFNTRHKFKRTRLTIDEALKEADVIASEGFRHILLLSGEDPTYASVEYFAELAKGLRKSFSAIDIEIYPCTTDEYKKLFDAGIDGITIYQETYNPKIYSTLHKKGPKKDYNFRLQTPQRAAEAGFRRIGIGSLLGISDWKKETLAMAEHCSFLMKNYWKSQVSVSFPRIRPAEQVKPDFVEYVSDADTVKMMIALRLCFPDAGVVLSTRENANFRASMLDICVTKISAGSKTNPGGYSNKEEETIAQFEIDDSRSPIEMAEVISKMGYETVWKDWDKSFNNTN